MRFFTIIGICLAATIALSENRPFDGRWYKLEGNSNWVQSQTSLTVNYTGKESGIVIRPTTPLFIKDSRLLIRANNQNPKPIRLNVKFWGEKETYQAWYVDLGPGESFLDVNLRGVTDKFEKVLIIRIYSDDPLPRPIVFRTFETSSPVIILKNKDAGLIRNGDFKFGMLGWEFWASNGRYEQRTFSDLTTWGVLRFAGYDPTTNKTEAFIASDFSILNPGSYLIQMTLRSPGNCVTDWKIAWDDPIGANKISGNFYSEPFGLFSNQAKEISSNFTIKQPLKSRLYIVNRSPTDLLITNVRLLKLDQHIGSNIASGKVMINGKKEFIIGYYHKNNSPLEDFGFKHIQPDGILSREYLDHCHNSGIKVWPELSGAIRARSYESLKDIHEIVLDHPAIAGLYTIDEPDHLETGVPPLDMLLVRRNIGNKHLTWATLMSWNESIHYQYSNSADILGIELYPVINGKDLNWCRSVLERSIKAAMGKPVFAVIEASPKLSLKDQEDLLRLPKALDVAGVFVWSEWTEKDVAEQKEKFEAFRLMTKKLLNE